MIRPIFAGGEIYGRRRLLVKYEPIRSKNAKVTADTRRKKKILPVALLDHVIFGFPYSPEAKITDFGKKKKKTKFFLSQKKKKKKKKNYIFFFIFFIFFVTLECPRCRIFFSHVTCSNRHNQVTKINWWRRRRRRSVHPKKTVFRRYLAGGEMFDSSHIRRRRNIR